MMGFKAYKKLGLLWVLVLFLHLTLVPVSLAATPSPNVSPRPTIVPASLAATPTNVSPRPTVANTPTQRPLPTRISTIAPPSPTVGPRLVTKIPTLDAVAAIALDADTGRILYAKNIHQQHPQASTTKIMTALTFLSLFPKYSNLQAETYITQADLVGEANMGLFFNEHIKLSSLLLGLLTNSANEAGMALARYAGERLSGPSQPIDRFVALMNTYALSLGMYDTHFMNPHGLDQAGHYSSAYDLAISGWYALRNPILMQYVQNRGGVIDGHYIYNVNSFLSRYAGATGIKPGFTDDAGHCLVASAKRNGNNVIVVVLDSPDMAKDTDTLMDYAFTLLAGRTEVALSSINLGVLGVPNAIQLTPTAKPIQPTRTPLPATPTPIKRKPAVSPTTLQSALNYQLDYTLQLAISLIPN